MGIVEQGLAAAFLEEGAHDGLARERELEAEELGDVPRTREAVEVYEVRDVLPG